MMGNIIAGGLSGGLISCEYIFTVFFVIRLEIIPIASGINIDIISGTNFFDFIKSPLNILFEGSNVYDKLIILFIHL